LALQKRQHGPHLLCTPTYGPGGFCCQRPHSGVEFHWAIQATDNAPYWGAPFQQKMEVGPSRRAGKKKKGPARARGHPDENLCRWRRPRVGRFHNGALAQFFPCPQIRANEINRNLEYGGSKPLNIPIFFQTKKRFRTPPPPNAEKGAGRPAQSLAVFFFSTSDDPQLKSQNRRKISLNPLSKKTNPLIGRPKPNFSRTSLGMNVGSGTSPESAIRPARWVGATGTAQKFAQTEVKPLEFSRRPIPAPRKSSHALGSP